PHATSREWKDLYTRIAQQRERLVGVVTAWVGGGKGGRAGSFVDPSMIAPVVQRLRRNWALRHAPEGADPGSNEYAQVARLHTQVAQALPAAIAAERANVERWLAEVD